MKHKTESLEGPLLDAAVAKALGLSFTIRHYPGDGSSPVSKALLVHKTTSGEREDGFYPSSRWDHGGPIIQQFHISIECFQDTSGGSNMRDVFWLSTAYGGTAAGLKHDGRGEHGLPLVAAMRAIVSAQLGEEVEVP